LTIVALCSEITITTTILECCITALSKSCQPKSLSLQTNTRLDPFSNLLVSEELYLLTKNVKFEIIDALYNRKDGKSRFYTYK
jgi:hypothetical protein